MDVTSKVRFLRKRLDRSSSILRFAELADGSFAAVAVIDLNNSDGCSRRTNKPFEICQDIYDDQRHLEFEGSGAFKLARFPAAKFIKTIASPDLLSRCIQRRIEF